MDERARVMSPANLTTPVVRDDDLAVDAWAGGWIRAGVACATARHRGWYFASGDRVRLGRPADRDTKNA